ncbi:hypothetical protein GCM10025868_06380 [Angustibacter aerolatus]|uniref:SseB protein N-terminal domain-containing protein n=1 Tax=Angustibacter aerolatus TaxID=1162965 RepID=A0ABQ6JB29_9ACTN|nr:hypothetical protein GCM10025868_06380 [Angustibacter aerolatus]
MALVTLTAPDGRRALPVFSGQESLRQWDPTARPVPVDARRAAVSAVAEGCDVVVLDPAGPLPFVLPRPALWAIGQGRSWVAAHDDPDVLAALRLAVRDEPDVVDVAGEPGEQAQARVRLLVRPGLDPSAVREPRRPGRRRAAGQRRRPRARRRRRAWRWRPRPTEAPAPQAEMRWTGGAGAARVGGVEQALGRRGGRSVRHPRRGGVRARRAGPGGRPARRAWRPAAGRSSSPSAPDASPCRCSSGACRSPASSLSTSMLAVLREKVDEHRLPVVVGDMATARVDGEFTVVYLVYNTISNLLTQDAQVECFANAARHLAPGGCFVIEPWVPEPALAAAGQPGVGAGVAAGLPAGRRDRPAAPACSPRCT